MKVVKGLAFRVQGPFKSPKAQTSVLLLLLRVPIASCFGAQNVQIVKKL